MAASEVARREAERFAEDTEERLAVAEASARDARSRLSAVSAGLYAADSDRQEVLESIAGLKSELAVSQNWLTQVAQYHRVYAETDREHLVEVAADERDHIEDWLTDTIGREIRVPDLSEFGISFAGARLLGINEEPVAQLVFVDENDQPLALCITPLVKTPKSPALSTNRDLNLLDWQDGRYGYALVGWSQPAVLRSLANTVRSVYDL